MLINIWRAAGAARSGTALGRRVTEESPIVALEVAKSPEPGLSCHTNQRSQRVFLEHLVRFMEPQRDKVILERGADGSVKLPTEVELAHVRD